MLPFPKEHGAYGQLMFPLITSFVVAGVTLQALLVAACVVAGFFAHEPLLVLIGERGVRARREARGVASLWLVLLGATALAAGVGVWWSVPAGLRWSFAVPVVPAAVLVVAIAARSEKRLYGEVAVALALSAVAVPVCVVAGAVCSTAFAVAIAFAVTFVSGTMAVRVIILNVRAGGDPRAVRATRVGVLAVAVASVSALWLTAARDVLPWATLEASVPGLVNAIWVSLSAPPPAQLRRVGWSFVAVSVVASVLLVAGLR